MTPVTARPEAQSAAAAPLLTLVDQFGAAMALGVRRVSREGRATKRAHAENLAIERAADLVAVHALHRTPREVGVRRADDSHDRRPCVRLT